MFGFLNPLVRSERYRRAYARCAEHHRLHVGFRALPFLSYESVFLYLCWLDAVAVEPECVDQDLEIGRFCSAATMILVRAKLEDEVRDGSPVLARAVFALLEKDFRRARDFFCELDPGSEATVRELIERHLVMEQGGVSVPMDDYARPTAEAFGFIGRLLARMPGVRTDAEVFAAIGASIASAFVAGDCIVDWRRDRDVGTFNPLRDAADIAEACNYVETALRRAYETATSAFGEGSLTAETLAAVRARVMGRLQHFRGHATESEGSFMDNLTRAVQSPVASHIDASPWSELRDKIAVSLAVLAGAGLDRLILVWRRLRFPRR